MNDLKIDVQKFSGSAQDGKWADNCLVTPSHSGIQNAGRLFFTISANSPKEFDIKKAGDFLIETMQDVYYEDEEKGVIDRLEKAIMSTAKRLEYLLQREEVAAEEGIDLNISVLVIKNEFVYMALLGDGKIMLSRDGKLIDLSEALKDLTGRNLIKTGSGKTKEEDRYILLSEEAVYNVEEKDIKSLVDKEDKSHLSKFSDNPLISLQVVRLCDESKKEQDDGSLYIGRDSADEDAFLGDAEEEEVEPRDDEEELGKESDRKNENTKEENEARFSQQQNEKQEKSVDERKTQDQEENKLKKVSGKIKDKLVDKKTYQVLFSKLKPLGIKLKSFFKEYIWKKLLGFSDKGLFLKGGRRGKKPIRGIMILILIVISLLFFSIRAIKNSKERKEVVQELEQSFDDIDERIESGRNLGSAGNISESVSVLEGVVDELNSLKEKEVSLDEINSRITIAQEALDEVRKAIIVDDSNLITDISGFVENGQANDITYKDGKLYIIDTNNGGLYSVGESSNEVNELLTADTIMTAPKSLVFNSEGDLIIYDNQKGLLKVNVKEDTAQELVGLSNTSVGQAVDIENYATPDGLDILYILRASGGDITKTVKYTSGYQFPVVRLADERIRDSVDIEIDGKIYILSRSDQVVRFFGDKADPYTLVGIDKNIENPTAMELDDLLVYVGDSAHNRVVVFSKGLYLTPQQGTFIAQLVYRGENDYLSDIKEIIVDGDSRVMYILDGTRIFKVYLTEVDKYEKELQ